MSEIGIASSIISWYFTASEILLAFERTISHYSDFGTSLDNLSKELEFLSRALEADPFSPQLMVCDEQSVSKSSAIEAVHQSLLSRSRISWKTRIEEISTRISSLEFCRMNHSSSVERAKAPIKISRLVGANNSLRGTLDGILKKLLRNAKRLFSDMYDPMSSRGGFAMQFEQKLQPRDMIFGRSLLAERLEPPSLDVGFDGSIIWNPVANSGDAFTMCSAAEGTLYVVSMKARPHIGAEFDIVAHQVMVQRRFRVLRWPVGVLITRYSHFDIDTLDECDIKSYLGSWKQLKAHTQTQSRNFLFLSRCSTLLPEPSKSQIYHCQHHPQRGSGVFTDARERNIMKISDPFIGDEGIGPNFGKLNIGREDDDDDNCVGFHRISGLENRNSALRHGGGRHGKFCGNDLQVGYLCGIIPKLGPPKRDPVAAAISGNFAHSTDNSTLAIWRDAITRTCGRNADFGPTAAKKWKEMDWKSAWETHGNARGEGGLMCAY